jgi:fibronectin-binding autotransporter adhesin
MPFPRLALVVLPAAAIIAWLGGSTASGAVTTYTSAWGGGTITAGNAAQINNGASITGNVATSGTLQFNRSTALTVSTTISGTGVVSTLATNTGTVTLSGNNTYTGGTRLNGGTLNLGSASAIGSSGPISFGGGTLQYSAVNTTDYSSRFSTAAGQAYSIDTNGQSVSFASQVASSGGSFTKLGSGTITLNNTVIDSDAALDLPTTVFAGMLQTGSNGGNNLRIGNSAAGTVTVVGGEFKTNIAYVGYNAPGAITVSSGTFIARGTAYVGFNSTGSGTLSVTGGSTTLFSLSVAENTGSLGTMTMSGGTVGLSPSVGTSIRIGASGTGSLALSDGSLSGGDILIGSRSDGVGSATVTGGTLTVTSLVVGNSGQGSLTILGGLVSSSGRGDIGFNSGATGSVAVTGGTLAVGSLFVGRTGGGTATLSISGSQGTGGFVSVSGTLSSSPTGSIVLASGGTLSIGSGGAAGVLASALVNDGTLIFNRSDAGTCGVVISGSGAVIKRGAGMLVMAGANTYSGLTTIESGTLRIGGGGTSGVLPGDVVNDASLLFDRSNNLTYSGRISGSGSVRKNGSGRLVLSGSSSYSGMTTVGSGTLEVNGILASTSLVQALAGSTLSGTGTIAGPATISGTHSPGAASRGTQTFNNGIVYLAGSAVNWELAANTDTDTAAFDRVVVTASSLVFTGPTALNLVFNAAGSTVRWTDSFWDVNRSWTIYDLISGASTPSLVNLVVGGSLLDSQGQSLSAERGSFSLDEVDGNVVLTFAAVPEPSAMALAAVGVAVAALARYSRSVSSSSLISGRTAEARSGSDA